MGITHVDMAVANPADLGREEQVRLLVDSGAHYSVVPAPVLRRLGIKPADEETFTLANGDQMVRKIGIAAFKFRQKVRGSDVVFGQPGDASLLGAFTLESLGLVLDPLKRELRETPLYMMRLRRSAVSSTDEE